MSLTMWIRRTDINDIATPASIEVKRRFARWTVLSVDIANKLIKAGFVGHVSTRKLQDAFSLQCVFQGFVAHRALAANKSSLAAQPASVRSARHDVVVDGSDSAGQSTGA